MKNIVIFMLAILCLGLCFVINRAGYMDCYDKLESLELHETNFLAEAIVELDEIPTMFMLGCCDCGLFHQVWVEKKDGKIILKWRRDQYVTLQQRAAKNIIFSGKQGLTITNYEPKNERSQ